MASSWDFWIDVGGTFTDCIARSPDDTLHTCKVLSSGITKGRVDAQTNSHRISDATRANDATGFWGGYRVLPAKMEFWQGRAGRLHDRVSYQMSSEGAWQLQRLCP